jgi:LacI family transcriptional regulator
MLRHMKLEQAKQRRAREPQREQLRIAIRLYDWSEWCRQVIRGVQRFAHERPHWKVVVAVGPPSVTRILREGIRWDGIITGVLRDVSGYQRVLRTDKTKVVALSATVAPKLKDLPAVRVDDTKVARTIGRHLFTGGFRRLAYSGVHEAAVMDHRAHAMEVVARENGCPLARMTLADRKNDRAFARWVSKLEKPVGIVSWNMEEARMVVEACQRAGIAVPQDVAVVAWDDDVMLAETLEPTISAAVLPAERLGFEAATMLDRLLEGEPEPKQPLLIEPVNILHVRQSSDVSTLEDRDAYLVLQYIREHSREALKISHIAHHLRISRRKLEQSVKRVTGQTPHQIIIGLRLNQAKQMLIETNWTAERIAERTGLGTKQTLHRLFIAREKLTPSAYRTRYAGT